MATALSVALRCGAASLAGAVASLRGEAPESSAASSDAAGQLHHAERDAAAPEHHGLLPGRRGLCRVQGGDLGGFRPQRAAQGAQTALATAGVRGPATLGLRGEGGLRGGAKRIGSALRGDACRSAAAVQLPVSAVLDAPGRQYAIVADVRCQRAAEVQGAQRR
eukprot:scaffold1610_cov257-Pinguiococcus_pyrenoidosus.AAC.47